MMPGEGNGDSLGGGVGVEVLRSTADTSDLGAWECTEDSFDSVDSDGNPQKMNFGHVTTIY